MFRKLIVKNNFYKDSIALMSITNKVNSLDGVLESTLGMGTDMNKEIIVSIGFSESELQNVQSNDMMIALNLKNEFLLDTVLEQIEELFIVKEENNSHYCYSNSKQAIAENQNLNMAVISIPGNQAYLEVKRCLENDINVMLFSDNMPIEEELKLKKLAVSKDLLMMGPDCGTSIINGVGLCFANKIQKGNIGIVGASGTGIQEVSVLIDKLGAGISHAIGTGGRDLSQEIGGLMMLQGMKMLEEDPSTEIILLISKPPAKAIAEKILNQAEQSKKTYIVCFINGDSVLIKGKRMQFAATLEEAGYKAASTSLTRNIVFDQFQENKIVEQSKKLLNKNQRYLRALYCGGTLAAETEMIISKDHMVYSNVSKIEERKLNNPFTSRQNTIIDLGDDIFTQGKPHPMIDPSIRNSRILKEAMDKNVAVMILDFELGYGSNSNPVGETLDTLRKVKQITASEGREIIIICYLLATNKDKQDAQGQRKLLEDLDLICVNSNAEAARIASSILKGL